jgi:hypothetical protein
MKFFYDMRYEKIPSHILISKSKFYSGISTLVVCILTYTDMVDRHTVKQCELCVPTHKTL